MANTEEVKVGNVAQATAAETKTTDSKSENVEQKTEAKADVEGSADDVSILNESEDAPDKGGDKAENDDGNKPDGDLEDKADEPKELTAEDIVAPEGYDFGEGGVEEVIKNLKDLGITDKEKAQKAIDFHTKAMAELVKKQEQINKNLWKETVETWKKETLADESIGGKNWKENREYALKAIKTYGDEDFSKLINEGFGNHKSVMKFLISVAKDMGEDTPSASNTKGRKEKELGDVLFPNVPKSRKQ